MIKNLFSKLFKKDEEIAVRYEHSIHQKGQHYKCNPIISSYKDNNITFEQAFDKVFARTEMLRTIKPIDVDEFKKDLLAYSNGKISPDYMVAKYNFGSRRFFTGNVVWGFWHFGFDFRTDHMREIFHKTNNLPEWIRKATK